MAIRAVITGNILTNPSTKVVNLPKGEVKVTEFRMMSDVWKNGGVDGKELVQDDDKTKPVHVTVWNERLGALVANTLRKGMRVETTGDLYLQETKASDADRGNGKQDYADLRCAADNVSLQLNRVEAVQMRERQLPVEGGASASGVHAASAPGATV